MVAFVKHTGGWEKTGIPLKSDQSIKAQVRSLIKEWQHLNKMKSKLCKPVLTEKQSQLVEAFKNKMAQTFLANDPKAEEIIRKDD